MARAYSADLRLRILKAYDEGMPIEDIVNPYAVRRATVYSYDQQRRETGRVAPQYPSLHTLQNFVS